MKDKKIREVMQNESFVKEISKMDKPEEVQAAFKNKGVDMSLDEVKTIGDMINVMATEKSTILLDEDLSRIAGGSQTEPPQPLAPQPLAPQPPAQPQEDADLSTGGGPVQQPATPVPGWSTTKKIAVGSGAVALAGIAATVIGYGGYRAMNWAKRRKGK